MITNALTYSGETGIFIWKDGFRYAGQQAGHLNATLGYLQIGFKGKRYYGHRLAWFMFYGREPDYIDHINGDKADNRIGNLRSVPKQENHKNTKLSSKSTSGITGVFWSVQLNKWIAGITVNRKSIHLGCFTTVEAAMSARKEAETLYGFHLNHGKR